MLHAILVQAILVHAILVQAILVQAILVHAILMQLCGTSIIEVIMPMSNEIHFGHAYSYAGVPYKLLSIPSFGLSYLATYDALCIFVHIVT